jgi:FlaA1/EpsC-like NDP-sugar epimerase
VNKIEWSQAELADAIDLLPPAMLATTIALFVNGVWEDQPVLPVVLIFMAAVLSYAGFVFARFRSRLVRKLVEKWLNTRGSALHAQERVLVIGGGESGQFMSWWLNNGRNEGLFRIVGYIDDDLYKKDTRIRGVNVLGNRQDIPRLIERYDVGIILFAIHNIPSSERNRLLDICHTTAARVYIVPDVLANLRHVAGVHDTLETEEAGRPGETGFDMGAWLDSLEVSAQDGDLQGVQEQIRAMREKWQQPSDGAESRD